jgi:hypothetical protein
MVIPETRIDKDKQNKTNKQTNKQTKNKKQKNKNKKTKKKKDKNVHIYFIAHDTFMCLPRGSRP